MLISKNYKIKLFENVVTLKSLQTPAKVLEVLLQPTWGTMPIIPTLGLLGVAVEVQGYPLIHSRLKASLSYMRFSFQINERGQNGGRKEEKKRVGSSVVFSLWVCSTLFSWDISL